MFESSLSYMCMTLHAMRVVAIMVRMLRFVDFCKKVAGEETNRQKEMRFDDLFLTKVAKTVCPVAQPILFGM